VSKCSISSRVQSILHTDRSLSNASTCITTVPGSVDRDNLVAAAAALKLGIQSLTSVTDIAIVHVYAFLCSYRIRLFISTVPTVIAYVTVSASASSA